MSDTDSEPLDYFTIAQLEGLGIKQIFDTQTRYKSINARPTEDFKIPPISHHIWLTHPRDPKELRPQDEAYLFKIIAKMDGSGTKWEHFLWTNCKACIPETNQKLQAANVSVRDISEIREQLVSYEVIQQLCDQKQFGIPADFLRFDLLRNFGGFYSDVNYIMAQSPEPYMKTFDFLVHTDRGGMFVDVYMIASIPHHPIMEEATHTVLRNFINPPHYVGLASNASMHIQEYTGVMTYMPFNVAFFKHVNQHTTDFAFPLEINDSYPVDAKRPHLDAESMEDMYQEEDSCNNDKTSQYQEEMLQMFQDYYHHEICVESILGFDSHDGNSWFEGVALYPD